jgi:hypothetical protein
MKILFISKYLFNYQFKGTQTRLQTLVSEFKKNNHEVSVICSKPNLKKKGFELSRIDKVDHFILYEKYNYKFNSFKRVFAWINFEYKVLLFNYNYLKFKPNIVYISSPSLITIINGIILKRGTLDQIAEWFLNIFLILKDIVNSYLCDRCQVSCGTLR